MANQSFLQSSRFVLAVKNLGKSADYYRINLGFKTNWSGEGWHFLERDNIFIMLGECADDKSAFQTHNHSYFAYIDVKNIDELYEEFKHKNIEIISKLEDKEWHQREFGIRTIDGHRIMFGEAISQNH